MLVNSPHQTKSSGAYTANLLGNIRSHLAGLQGYDIMALELIQNADDARAESVIFDVTDEGLYVFNSGQFTYCGDLNNECAFLAESNYKCDYHRITDVGSGGKLARNENIGRFGIGFVSTYQITDHPEIRSSGIKLTLLPEKGEWNIESFHQPSGTTFFLPWANDPKSVSRTELCISHVSSEHIDQLIEDFKKVLRKSLLFLRNIKTAELRRNGKLIFGCGLNRKDDSNLTIAFSPSNDVEQWYILRTDAKALAEELVKSYPHLKKLERGTDVSIGLKISPEPLAEDEGLLYAFLPTEQSSGLPLHINADFFPEADRKAIIFAGHQHEQKWNEMLIEIAAKELARNPEELLRIVGEQSFWQIASKAYELSRNLNGPRCFKKFWQHLAITMSNAPVVRTRSYGLFCPREVFFSDRELTEEQVNVLVKVGVKTISEELRKFRAVLTKLGLPILTFERLMGLLEEHLLPQDEQIEEEHLSRFYLPLWEVINELAPKVRYRLTQDQFVRLENIPLMVTEDLFVVTMAQTHLTPDNLSARHVAELLPRLAIATHHLTKFPKLAEQTQQLSLDAVAKHIQKLLITDEIEDVISIEKDKLRELYALLAGLDHSSDSDGETYQALVELPIWLSKGYLISAEQALLPGNFTDPTGQANLLDTSVLNIAARDFLLYRLGVKTQSIEAFVHNVLPNFFDEAGPKDESKYPRLIKELANYPSLLDEKETRQLLGNLLIVPTQDGGWARPDNVYKRKDELIKVLGDNKKLWLDENRLPSEVSVRSFIEKLGLRYSPIAQHLVERMISIAEDSLPTEEAQKASSESFYFLCDRYEKWKDEPFFQEAIDMLSQADCFPADDDKENWYSSDELYAPFRAEAFRSQASILNFKNTSRLKTEFLDELGVTIKPETDLVVDHLLHCIETNEPPQYVTYQILNERADELGDKASVLANSRCVYVESQKTFVHPSRLYWIPQQLGHYAFTIPTKLEVFKPLFNAIGVKDKPEGREYLNILLEIVKEHFEQSKAVVGAERAIYDACLRGIADSYSNGELSDEEVEGLRKSPSILNLAGLPHFPDELLLQDSEWHTKFFNKDLNQALCKSALELWEINEKIGLKRLSDNVRIILESVNGAAHEEAESANVLKERVSVLIRFLHDKPNDIQSKVKSSFSKLKITSYDSIRIQAHAQVGEDWIEASPVEESAFFNENEFQLVLTRPIVNRVWISALNSILHQLMPEESGSEISKLTLNFNQYLTMDVEEAHELLTDAGIPNLEDDDLGINFEELASLSLDDFGDPVEEASAISNDELTEIDEEDVVETSLFSHGEFKKPIETKQASDISIDADENQQKYGAKKNNEHPSLSLKNNLSSHSGGQSSYSDRTRLDGSLKENTSRTKNLHIKKSRPEYKKQWDRRLISYVQKEPNDSNESIERKNTTEHNLAVETVARTAVCEYEKERGRIAEQMAQTHPGYDIISRDPVTKEERFIEVKGVNGEWGQTGVGLSRLQFENAQRYGEHYWLYVVEFVSSPENIRVHTIQSPASEVTAFMFDGNWRDAAVDEKADPSLQFIPGARIQHDNMGKGVIQNIQTRGTTKLLTIQFDDKPQTTPNVPLNLYSMRVLEEEADDIDNSYSL